MEVFTVFEESKGIDMREKQLAICDKDIRYLEMMQTYLMRNKIADFQILIFDNLESAEKAI